MAAYHHVLAAILVLTGSLPAAANRGRMVEIQYQGQSRTGTVVLHNASTGWFLERDGRLQPVTLNAVDQFKELGSFRPWGFVELREKLALEFGVGYSVASSGHYLVVAPQGTGETVCPVVRSTLPPVRDGVYGPRIQGSGA